MLLVGIVTVLGVRKTVLKPKADDIGTMTVKLNPASITDGNAPFDSDNVAGDDMNDHNGIVRSNDAVSIPFDITLMPAITGTAYKVTVEGYVKGGIAPNHTGTGDRLVAWAKPNDTSTDTVGIDKTDKETTFKQVWILNQTQSTPYLVIQTGLGHNGDQFQPVITSMSFTAVDSTQATAPQVFSYTNLPTYTLSARPSINVSNSNSNPEKIDSTQTNADKSQLLNLQTPSDIIELQPIHANSTSIIGATFPDIINYTKSYAGSLSDSSATLPPFSLTNTNLPQIPNTFTVNTDYGGSAIGAITATNTSNQSDFKTFNIQLTNIDTLNYLSEIGKQYPSTPYFQIEYNNELKFLNEYAAGAPNNPNSLDNTITISSPTSVNWQNLDGTTGTFTASGNTVTDWDIYNTAPVPVKPFYYFSTVYDQASLPYLPYLSYQDQNVLTGQPFEYSWSVGAGNQPSDVLENTFSGGYTTVDKFNPNSFKLDASIYDNVGTSVKFGILKAPGASPYTAANIFSYTKDDYTWWDTYTAAQAAAVKNHSLISAVSYNNTDSFSFDTDGDSGSIGGLTLTSIGPAGVTGNDGNPNTVALDLYVYPDKDRKTEIFEHNYTDESNNPGTEATLADNYVSSRTINPDGTSTTYDTGSGRFSTIQVLGVGYPIAQLPNYCDTDSTSIQSSKTINLYTPSMDIPISPENPNKKYKITLKYQVSKALNIIPDSFKLASSANDNGAWSTSYPRTFWQNLVQQQKFSVTPQIITDPNDSDEQDMIWALNLSYNDLKDL